MVPIDILDPMAISVTVATTVDSLFIFGILSMPLFFLLLIFCNDSCFQSLKQIDTVLERACRHRKDVL